jgi:hypothetical protein
VITFVEAGGTMTGTYQPTDAAQPALCHLSLSSGETRTLLYNLYETKAVSDVASASQALEELLSGRKDQVEFQNRWMAKYPFPVFLESWTRLGQETLDIDNRQVVAIAFEHDTDGIGFAGYSYVTPKRWKVWYDPAVGVIRQTEVPLTESQNAVRRDGPQVFFVSPL